MNKTLIHLVALLAFASSVHAELQYQLLKEIPVPGDPVCKRLAVDETAGLLYLLHGDQIDVLDLAGEHLIGQVTNLAASHDFALSPAAHVAFVSCPQQNEIAIVDLRTLKAGSKLRSGKQPGFLMVDGGGLLSCFSMAENLVTVFEADDGDLVGSFSLMGKVRSAVGPPKGRRLFCALPDKNEIAVFDLGARKITANWPLSPGEAPSAMAYEPASNHLLVGCSNKLMVMMNPANGRVTASIPTAAAVSGCAVAPGLQLAVCSAEDGTLTFARVSASGLSVIQTLKTEPGLRAIAIDNKTHKFYVAAGRVESYGNPAAHGLKILVYGASPVADKSVARGSKQS